MNGKNRLKKKNYVLNQIKTLQKISSILLKLANTLVNFQGYINKIFVEKYNIFIIIYLNNILIYIFKKCITILKNRFLTS